MQSIEEWRPVSGYEGAYEVSDQGRVRSVDRVDSAGRRLRGRLLSAHPKPFYLSVTLSAAGVHRYFYVHRLVAYAFLPIPEGAKEVCHGDGNRSNNSLDNLRWDSHSSNQLDMVTHGNHRNARKTHCLRGHEFTPENIYWTGDSRHCKACTKMRGTNRRRSARA